MFMIILNKEKKGNKRDEKGCDGFNQGEHIRQTKGEIMNQVEAEGKDNFSINHQAINFSIEMSESHLQSAYMRGELGINLTDKGQNIHLQSKLCQERQFNEKQNYEKQFYNQKDQIQQRRKEAIRQNDLNNFSKNKQEDIIQMHLDPRLQNQNNLIEDNDMNQHLKEQYTNNMQHLYDDNMIQQQQIQRIHQQKESEQELINNEFQSFNSQSNDQLCDENAQRLATISLIEYRECLGDDFLDDILLQSYFTNKQPNSINFQTSSNKNHLQDIPMKSRSINHEKNMKIINKMIQNQNNNYNQKQFQFQPIFQQQDMSHFSLESYNSGDSMQKNSMKQKQEKHQQLQRRFANQKEVVKFEFDKYVGAATEIQRIFKGYMSRKKQCEFGRVKRAVQLIETHYLQFRQFLMRKMKDCQNHIECSCYNIIKLVKDFERGEKFLKDQFRRRDFDQRIQGNHDKLSRIFIQFINNGENKLFMKDQDLTTEQKNLKLEREVLNLKSQLQQQEKVHKQQVLEMKNKYDHLRRLHKETIQKYILGIQNLSQKNSIPKSPSKINQSKRIQQNKEGIFNHYYQTDRRKSQQTLQKQEDNQNERHIIQFPSNKKHDHTQVELLNNQDKAIIQKQIDFLHNQAEKDLENVNRKINKIKYEYNFAPSKSSSPKRQNILFTYDTKRFFESNNKSINSLKDEQNIQNKSNIQELNYKSAQSLMTDQFINNTQFNLLKNLQILERGNSQHYS